MKRKFVKVATAVILSASMLFESAAPILAEETVSGNDAVTIAEDAVAADQVEQQADEELAAESVSEDSTPKEEEPPVEEPKVSAPANVSAIEKQDGSSDKDKPVQKTIVLSWTPVSGASGYRIESSTNNKNFVFLWDIKDGKASSMDVIATNEKMPVNIASSYSFRIQAYVEKDGKTYYSGYSNATAAITPGRSEAEWNLTATAKDYKSVELSWKPAIGITGYKVLISNSETGTFQQLTTTTTPSAVITKDAAGKALNQSKTYYFKVQAYLSDTPERTSTLSAAAGVKPVLAAPKLKTVKGTAGKITITWKKVPGATGYEVYRSKKKNKLGSVIAGGKKKTKLNTVTKLKKLKYVDKNGAIGQDYWYSVRAYRTIGGKRYYSERSSWPWAMSTVLARPTIDANNSGCVKPGYVTLSWKKVNKAKGYFIEYSDKKDKGYKRVLTVKGGNSTSADIPQDVLGAKYYYRVQAYTKETKKKTWSYTSEPIQLTYDFYCYPNETYQQRCQRVFGKDSYTAYANKDLADKAMKDVTVKLSALDAKKKVYVDSNKTFKVNKNVQPTVQNIINEIQAANIKILKVSGYNFDSTYQEDREGIAVTIEVLNPVTGQTAAPGSDQYNAVTNIMGKYGFNRFSNYGTTYDINKYVYVSIHGR